MVAEKVIHRRALLRGDSLRTGIEILDQRAGAAGPFEACPEQGRRACPEQRRRVVAEVDGGRAAKRFTRKQLDRLKLGEDLETIPWGSKMVNLPPSKSVT